MSRAAVDCAWRRVERLIRTDIQSGALNPFDRLRSEKELAAEHGVGLSAVRRALQELKAAGLVVTKPKSGVFVAPPAQSSRAQAHTFGAGLSVFDIIHHATCNLRFTVADWRQALREFQKRSTVSSEMAPGYSAFIATILLPLSGRFLGGELDAAALIREVEERGARFFARQAVGDGSPAAETSRPRQQANFERP